MSEGNRFVVGESWSWCLLSLLPTKDCSHCRQRDDRPPDGPALVVTDVDQDAGVVTLSVEDKADAPG